MLSKKRLGKDRSRGRSTALTFLRGYRRILQFPISLPAAFLLLILSCSCGQSDSWSEALKETSPPNPRESQIGPFGAKATAPPRAAEEAAAAVAEENPDSERSPGGSSTVSLGRGATVELAFEGDMSCVAGDVRCSLDGRYVGTIVEGLAIKIALDPGRHRLEAWDNRGGRWLAEFEIDNGGEARLPLRCADRRTGGDF